MFTAAFLAVCAAMGGVSLFFAVSYWRRLTLPSVQRDASVTVVLPFTGNPPTFEALLTALERQTLRPRRLIIAVESETDPAFRIAHAAAQRTSFPVEIVCAGLATDTGQKCFNLIAAIARLDERDDALVLADSDIRPQDWWLSALVTPTCDGTAEIVSGYRWPVLRRHRIGAHLIAAIERPIAILPRPGFARILWAGSAAFGRTALQSLDLRSVLSHTLSDDISLSAAANARGLRILMRRALQVPSPVEHDAASAFRFARRQYQICRHYSPRVWSLGLVTVTARLAVWALIAAAVPGVPAAVAGATILLACAAAKQAVLQRIGARLDIVDDTATRAIQYLLAVAQPLVDLYHFAIIASSMSRRVVWAHVAYEMRGSEVRVTARAPWSGSSD